MTDQAITLTNTLLPMAIIGAVAVVLPYALTPRGTRSQTRVTGAVGITAVAMFGISAVVLAVFDSRDLPEGGTAGAVMIGWFYLRSALGAIAVWAPVLGLVWLGLAQRVERLRGEDMARGPL
ncbi:MAG: hypothetical protein AAGA28_13720 [Pseudomonadota bacterium]